MNENDRVEHGERNGWWEDRSLGQKILMGIGLGILGIGLLGLFGWAVMALWNWLMPDIFGLKQIGYWQAWGLMVLSAIFFKGLGSGNGGGRRDRKRKRQLRRYMNEDQAEAEQK
jgi:hypothetical protein